MNINEIVTGMTPQEKDIYFAHQAKRNREEAEKLESEKAARKSYKESLIADILRAARGHSAEELSKLSIRSLERISDNI